jgi:HD-like signal output (HDOD) protein
MSAETRKILERKFRDVYQLPTLPDTYAKLRRIMMSPKTSAHDVAAVIEQDQALSTKVLKIVNSAFYGFPQKVATISHATVILGFNEIRNIAFSASVINMFGNDSKSQMFNHAKFWEHALAVAAASRIIAKLVGVACIKNPEEAFMAGLVHDIGKIIQDQFMGNEYTPVLQRADRGDCLLIEAEREVLGFDHQDVGQFVGENWNLPSILTVPIGYHNAPGGLNKDDPAYAMVCVVHVADALARAVGKGWAGDRFVPQISPACWARLGLKKSHIEVIMNDTVTACAELQSIGVA